MQLVNKNILLLEQLKAYNPTDEEADYKIKMINFIKNNNDCFERFLKIGHITASAWLLDKSGSKVLLMHHAKLDKWVQLGGHCDGNHDTLAVAIKEAQEESGITQIIPVFTDIFDIDIHLIPENKKEQAHYHYDVRYLLKVNSDEQPIINNESKELKWFGKNINELPTQDPSVVRMFNRWINIKK